MHLVKGRLRTHGYLAGFTYKALRLFNRVKIPDPVSRAEAAGVSSSYPNTRTVLAASEARA